MKTKKSKACAMCAGGKDTSYLCPACQRWVDGVIHEQRVDEDAVMWHEEVER